MLTSRGYMWSHAITYTSHVQSHADTCSHNQSHPVTCSHIQSHAVISSHIQSYPVICSHMQIHAVTSGHMQSHSVLYLDWCELVGLLMDNPYSFLHKWKPVLSWDDEMEQTLNTTSSVSRNQQREACKHIISLSIVT